MIKSWKELKHEGWGKLIPFYRPITHQEIEELNAPLGENDTREVVKIEKIFRWHKDRPSEWWFREVNE